MNRKHPIDPTFFFREFASPKAAADAVCAAIPGTAITPSPRDIDFEYFSVHFPEHLSRLNDFGPGIGPSGLNSEFSELVDFDVWRTALAFADEVDYTDARPKLRELAYSLTANFSIKIAANNVEDDPYGDAHFIEKTEL